MKPQLTTKEFISKAILKHGNRYDYSQAIYTKNRNNVTIICKEHGKFYQKAYVHLRGSGCKLCFIKNHSSNTEEFIIKAKKVHGDQYDYSQTNYTKALDKIQIICRKHGVFYQKANGHLNGAGCIQCGFEKTADSSRKTTEQFILDARSVHGNRYDYSQSKYVSEHTKLKILCKQHGDFWQSPHVHLRRDRCGCPKCKFSKGEQRISKYLEDRFIEYEHQKMFPNCRNPKTSRLLKFDFYVPSYNLLIEYDGDQHFMYGRKLGHYVSTENDLKNVQFRDSVKTEYAKNANIRLVRIKYTELSRIESILNDNLTK